MSNSTSMPSSAKKPSSCATKSFNPMPLGATRTLRIEPPSLAPTIRPRSELAGDSERGVERRALLHVGAARDVVGQASQLDAAQRHPVVAQVVAGDQPELPGLQAGVV